MKKKYELFNEFDVVYVYHSTDHALGIILIEEINEKVELFLRDSKSWFFAEYEDLSSDYKIEIKGNLFDKNYEKLKEEIFEQLYLIRDV